MFAKGSSGIIETFGWYRRIQDDPTEILSDDLILRIFTFLTGDGCGVCGLVNRRWKRISQDSKLPINKKSLHSDTHEFLRIISEVDPVSTGLQSRQDEIHRIGYVDQNSIEMVSASSNSCIKRTYTPRGLKRGFGLRQSPRLRPRGV